MIATLTRTSQDAKKKKKLSPPNKVALYQIPMSLGFLVVSLAVGVGISFILGSMARKYVAQSQAQAQGQVQAQTGMLVPRDPSNFRRSLPPPVLGASKELPASTRYSSKRYKTEGTASESFLVRSYTSTSYGQERQSIGNSARLRFSLDISGSSKHTLDKRLASESDSVQLLKEIMKSSRSTILSYHCDQISLQHMTCVGIATQGHIILHKSPHFISIDINGISLEEASVEAILGQSLVATSVPNMEQKDTTKTRSQKEFRAASAFIHPAMLFTVDPKTVVLVGGSVASLKQMLQHVAVERLVLLEMEPSWNANDEAYPRLEQHTQTAAEWFALADADSVDAVFVESPGPSEIVPDIKRVLKAHNSTLAIQTSSTQRAERETTAIKAHWIQALSSQDGGFDSIMEYDEGDANFLVAFTDDMGLLGRWYANEAELQLSIRERVLPPYEYIDATSILSYQNPSREAANAFCADNPEDDACINGNGLDPEREYVPISSFEVQLSTVENAGRGIYAKHDIDEGTYVFLDTCVQNIHLSDATIRVIDNFVDNAANATVPMKHWNVLMGYADGYGFTAEDFGYRAYDVDPGIATFVNHGCNGTANVGNPEYQYLTELSYNGTHSSEAEEDEKSYNPAMDRSRRTVTCAESLAMRNMERGEEVFNNYMTFVASEDMDEYVESLRAECSGQAVGQVSEYEMTANRGHRILSGQQEYFELDSNLTMLNSSRTESCLHCGIRMQEIS